MIAINEAEEVIKLLPNEFDSHDFFKAYVMQYPASYLEMLRTYGDVTVAHAQIGTFLKQHQDDANVEQLGKVMTENIFGRESECEKWRKK